MEVRMDAVEENSIGAQQGGGFKPPRRVPFVCEALGWSVPTLYRRMAQGRFPRPMKLTDRTVGFTDDQISAELASRKQSTGAPRTHARAKELEAVA